MARRLIVGDIHSQYRLLKEVLEKADFDPDEDILYSVGDLCDKGNNPGSVLRFLYKLKNFRPVLGNHDMFLEYYLNAHRPAGWIEIEQGKRTRDIVRSVMKQDEKDRIRLWLAHFPVLRVEDNAIIAHGDLPAGYTEKELECLAAAKRAVPLLHTKYGDMETLDRIANGRNYFSSAILDAGVKQTLKTYTLVEPLKTRKMIFLGHSPLDSHRPFYSKKYHLIAIDTGAGSGDGPLTLMDMDTHEYWQAGPDAISDKGKLAIK